MNHWHSKRIKLYFEIEKDFEHCAITLDTLFSIHKRFGYLWTTFKNRQICNLMHGLLKINHQLFSVKTFVTFSIYAKNC